MAQIVVRKLDDSVLAKIKARARTNRRSAEAEVRYILTAAVKPTKPKRVPLTSLIGAARSGRTQEQINADVRALRDEWDR
jgi:antitoxin FitA